MIDDRDTVSARSFGYRCICSSSHIIDMEASYEESGERSRICTHTDEGTDFDVSCISSTGQESVLCQIPVERGRPQVWASNLSIANVNRRRFIADSTGAVGGNRDCPVRGLSGLEQHGQECFWPTWPHCVANKRAGGR